MLSHRHNWLSALLLLLLPPMAFAGGANDPPMVTYRTKASEVRIAFFVTDETDHPLDLVGKDDFAVIDGDMVLREFRSLARSDETALDVVVMVDASESVTAHFQETMNDVLQLASQEQASSDDNFSVVSFAGLQPVLLCTRDCRAPEAGQKLRSVKAAGATPLFDALAYSADFLSRRYAPAVRPILILFSDGDDTISKTSAQEALQAVIAGGALLYTIDLNQPEDRAAGSATLRRMAEATGGRYFSTREGAANVLQAALEDLRVSYVVTYQLPSQVVGFHALRILPKHNLNLRFHCRSGYYYGQTNP